MTELHGSEDDILAPQTGRLSRRRVVTATTDFPLAPDDERHASQHELQQHME